MNSAGARAVTAIRRAAAVALSAFLCALQGAPSAPAGARPMPPAAPAYAHPASLGGGLFSFRARLGGQIYAFPCPLAALAEDGWALCANGGETLSAGEYARVRAVSDSGAADIFAANTGGGTLPLAECDAVGFEIAAGLSDAAEAELPAGVGRGTPRAALRAAYGRPDGEAGAQVLRYSAARGAFAEFTLGGGGRVAGIKLWCAQRPATAPRVDGLPPEARAYAAPGEIGDTWQSFSLRYGGALYTLPAPAAAFLENGWLLRDEGTVPAGGFAMRVSLQKDGQILRTTLRNPGARPQPLWACFVTMVEWAAQGTDIPLELSGGVSRYTDFDGVSAAWGPPDEVSRYGDSTWDVYYTSGGGGVILRFSKTDDSLMNIEVWNG